MLLRWFVLVVTVGLLAAPPPAGAVRVRARFPAVVTTGALVRVPGRVSGSLQVRLEQRGRGRWVRRGARGALSPRGGGPPGGRGGGGGGLGPLRKGGGGAPRG